MGGEISPEESRRWLRDARQAREDGLHKLLSDRELEVQMLIHAINGEKERTRKRILRRFNKLVRMAKTVTSYESEATAGIWPVEGPA